MEIFSSDKILQIQKELVRASILPDSVMHSLFALEDQYRLHAYRDESGVPQLMFKDKGHDSLNMLEKVGEWANMYQKYRNEEITEKEYLDWKSQFSVV